MYNCLISHSVRHYHTQTILSSSRNMLVGTILCWHNGRTLTSSSQGRGFEACHLSWQCERKWWKINFQKYHIRYFEPFALQSGSRNWVHTTRIHSFQRQHHFGAKTSWSTFMVEKLDSTPSKSGSSLPIRIDAYFVLFKEVYYWNTVT